MIRVRMGEGCCSPGRKEALRKGKGRCCVGVDYSSVGGGRKQRERENGTYILQVVHYKYNYNYFCNGIWKMDDAAKP